MHLLFWLGKDNAWNHFGNEEGNGTMWLIFLVPTLSISVDFIICTFNTKSLLLEHAHYRRAPSPAARGAPLRARGELVCPGVPGGPVVL